MKIWTEIGSSHSGNVTVVGTFKTEQDATKAFDIIDDFARASWEQRYPNAAAFRQAWESRIPDVKILGPNDADFETGIDNDPDAIHNDDQVTVTSFRSDNVGGFVKILFMLGMEKIEISGHGA
jgi:hypothetical protein